MAGSTIQLVNGIVLTTVFFFVRLVYGFYSSFQWYRDVWNAPHRTYDGVVQVLPTWVIGVFVVSNVTLNSLNVIWLGKMIQTINNRARAKANKEE